jgi:hypothetical protein
MIRASRNIDPAPDAMTPASRNIDAAPGATTRARRLVLALLLALALGAAVPAAPALAQGDTTAVAINTKDGATLFKFAFQVRRTMQDVVDTSNAAVAISSCNECTTTAISFQVLLVGGNPSTVTPTNIALAYNIDCTSCVTAAFAYQFVLGEPGPLHFTADGNRRIAELRKRLRALDGQELTLDQLQAQLDAAAAELSDILAHEVVAVGPPGGSEGNGTGAAEPAPSATPTPTPEASPTATPSPTASPTASPQPTATPTQ